MKPRHSEPRQDWLFILAVILTGFSQESLWKWLAQSGAARDFSVAKPADSFRIVTWNVGQATGHRGRPLNAGAVDHVAAVLQDLTPDLVVLCELENERQAQTLADRLGHGWKAEISSAGERRVAILSPYFFEGLTYHARRSVGAGIQYQSHTWVTVGVHADAYSSRQRNQQIGSACEALEGLPASGSILAGDFNLDLDLDKRRDLFTDDEHLDVQTYNYVAMRMVDAARGTGSTAEPDRRLDYIFVSPEMDVKQAGVVRGRRRGGMDHDPVVADVTVDPGSSP